MPYSDFKEKITHGSRSFPLQYYAVNKTHPRYQMHLHWHKEFEIIRVNKGMLKGFINNAPYTLCSGDVLMVNCGCLHRAEAEDCEYECIVFDMNMINKSSVEGISKYIYPLINHTVSVRPLFKKEADEGMLSLIDRLFLCLNEKNEYFELKIFLKLFELFLKLYENGDIIQIITDSREKKQFQNVSVLLDFIENHFKENITLSDLSKASGMNEKYICSLFKKYTAQTPIECITRLRIDSAGNDIIYNNLSVTEAALENGFNDVSYFSKTFKKIKGITPNAFKKKHITAEQ